MFFKIPLFKRPEPPAKPKGVRVDASYPYHAVAVKCGLRCCRAARQIEDKRMLSRSAPVLPLQECDSPGTCTCHFLKFNDRRQEQRRIFGSATDARFYAGTERRYSMGRRAADR